MKGKSGRMDERSGRGRVKEGKDREPRCERKEMDTRRELGAKRRGAGSGVSCEEGASADLAVCLPSISDLRLVF